MAAPEKRWWWVGEFEEIPWWAGFVKVDDLRPRYLVLPIPLCVLARWGLGFYRYLQHGRRRHVEMIGITQVRHLVREVKEENLSLHRRLSKLEED